MALGPTNMDSLLPGRNPTGSTALAADYSIMPGIGSTSGANPVMPPLNIPSGAPATNPYDPSSVIPTFGANAGPYSSTNLAGGIPGPGGAFGSSPGSPVGSFANLSKSSLQSMARDLTRTYGAGVAQAIMDFLQGGAGFNQSAINNLFAALQPQINRGEQDLLNQFSTSGNRFSSGSQIGIADFLSQVNLNEGQLETQMYEQATQNYMDVLMGVAGANMGRKASSPSFMDKLSGLLPIIGAGAGAASSAGVGGTAGSILDVIASMGAAA
jgi:hypothetical protein